MGQRDGNQEQVDDNSGVKARGAAIFKIKPIDSQAQQKFKCHYKTFVFQIHQTSAVFIVLVQKNIWFGFFFLSCIETSK